MPEYSCLKFFGWYLSNIVTFLTKENLCLVLVKQLSRANSTFTVSFTLHIYFVWLKKTGQI